MMDETESYHKWDGACNLFDGRQYEESKREFEVLSTSGHVCRSRILFNIGCICMIQSKYDEAIKVLEHSILLDTNLCLAYHQLAVAFCLKKRYKDALVNFQRAFNLVKLEDDGSPKPIDYSQLGLDYRYYAFEALFCAAICQQHLGNRKLAYECLRESKKLCEKQLPQTSSQCHDIHRAINTLQRGEILEVRQIPSSCIFKLQKVMKDRIKVSDQKPYLPHPTVTKSASGQSEEGTESIPKLTSLQTGSAKATQHLAKENSQKNTFQTTKPESNKDSASPNFLRKLFRSSPVGSKEDLRSQFFVPASYEQIKPKVHRHCFIALYPHRINEDGFLSFDKDDHIELVNQVNTDWIEVKIKGEKGMVPKNYIKKCPKCIT